MRSHFLADACGIMGLYGAGDVLEKLRWGLHALQHRGQRFSGAGVATDEGLRVFIQKGLVEEGRTEELSRPLQKIGIGHVGRREPQPVKHRSRFGEMALCFSGHLRNSSEVLADMLAQGRSFAQGSQAEVLSKVIGSRHDVAEGLKRAYDLFKGAFSLLVMTRSALYVARDPLGIRPLVLGWRQGQWAVASESRALAALGFQIKRDVAPGEILRLDGDGVEPQAQMPSPRRAHCAFEWAYIAGHDSKIEDVWVRNARKQMGEALADSDAHLRKNFDVVAPVPRSGIGSALGYQASSGLPYDEIFLDRRSDRWRDEVPAQSPSDKEGAPESPALSVVTPAVAGRRIVLCDDSLVRGRQIKHRIWELRAAGAKEIHVRIACPPLLFPCDYGSAHGKAGELMAQQLVSSDSPPGAPSLEALQGQMSRLVGADTLRFNPLERFVESIGLSRADLCLKCFDGRDPEGA